MKKTLEMLKKVPRGTYLPESQPCYDEEELKELASILDHLLYAPAPIRKRLQQYGITVTPANFYSEIPLLQEIEESFKAPKRYCMALFDDRLLKSWLTELDRYAEEFAPPLDAHPGTYCWNGSQVSYSDGMSLYCSIRRINPKHVIEIGSGSSSLITLQALSKNGQGRLTCIEPFPAEYLRARTDLQLVTRKAQDITSEFLNDELADGDVLFIDSTHTVKHGSDCLEIYLNLLPAIRKSIYVHVHDVYLPNSFPVGPLRDRQIYWTEQYLLGAYLTDNPRTKILYGSTWHDVCNRDALKQLMRGRYRHGGSSLWFTQAGIHNE